MTNGANPGKKLKLLHSPGTLRPSDIVGCLDTHDMAHLPGLGRHALPNRSVTYHNHYREQPSQPGNKKPGNPLNTPQMRRGAEVHPETRPNGNCRQSRLGCRHIESTTEEIERSRISQLWVPVSLQQPCLQSLEGVLKVLHPYCRISCQPLEHQANHGCIDH